MDTAIVIGGNTLIGQKVAERLISMGMSVIALGDDFSKTSLRHACWHPVAFDLFSSNGLDAVPEKLRPSLNNTYALIMAGRVTARRKIQDLHPDDVAPLVHANITMPLEWLRHLMPALQKSRGYIVRIGWNGRGEAPGNSMDALCEGAWHHLYRKLFEDVRNTGVKIATVYPEANTTADASPPHSSSQSHINPELVAETLESILRLRETNLIHEIVVRPQATHEQPSIARTFDRIAVPGKQPRLPDQDNRLPVQPPIITPTAKRPADAPPPNDTDDFDEEEIELSEAERKLLTDDLETIERELENPQNTNKNRKRRRRGGRRRRSGSTPEVSSDQGKATSSPSQTTANNNPQEPAVDRTERPATTHTAPRQQSEASDDKPSATSVAKKKPARKRTARKRTTAKPADSDTHKEHDSPPRKRTRKAAKKTADKRPAKAQSTGGKSVEDDKEQ